MLASGAKATIGENTANNGGVFPADACAGVDAAATLATVNLATFACAAATDVTLVTGTARAGGTTLTYTPLGCVDNPVKYSPAECRALVAPGP